jgi:CRP-like cAMP-binding protein
MLTELPLDAVRDRALLLRSLGSFSELDDEALATIAEHARLRRWTAGEVLAPEGGQVTHVYVVLSGTISSRRGDKLIASAPRGRVVGILSLLAGEPSTALVAESETSTMEIPSYALLAALEDNFSMVRNTLRNLARALVRKRGDLPAPPDRAPPVELGEWRDQPRTLVETVLTLRARGGPLARGNLDAVFAMGGAAREQRFAAGEYLWRIGEPSTFLMRVEYGRVRCTSADGKSLDVGAGFVLGPLDALGQVDRSYDARAETAIIGYRTSLDAYLAVLENYFDVARELIATLARGHLDTPEDEPKKDEDRN